MKVTLEFDFDAADGPDYGTLEQEMWRHLRATDLSAALYQIYQQALRDNMVTFEFVAAQLDANHIDFEEIYR